MSSLLGPVDELLFDARYPQLKEYVIAVTGLAYYTDKDAELVRRVCRRWPSHGVRDCASYLEILRDPLRGPAERDALIAEITIGETHFYRHQEHFEALREIVLPVLMARNASGRRLRIWSAGCADGAEPYSLSVLLKREMSHMFAGWDVAILGTDINRQSLAAAREGRFVDWSLRSTSDKFRNACFANEGKHWLIHPQYREGVSFLYHNLAEDGFPPAFSPCSHFDLIVCRNVMIYFAAELMRKIVRQFHECLAPGGWLLVGPSEPNMTFFTSFRAVNVPGVTLYQKPSEPASVAAQPIPGSAPPMHPVPLSPAPLETRLPQSIGAPADTNGTSALAGIRQLADRGDWEEAARLCEASLDGDGCNPGIHFHHALVLEQLGKLNEAERSLRRAIYLDRQSVLAHYHLGLLLRSRGDFRQASRCFGNTSELLLSRPDGEVLPEADGITVAELKQLTRTQIASLSGQI